MGTLFCVIKICLLPWQSCILLTPSLPPSCISGKGFFWTILPCTKWLWWYCDDGGLFYRAVFYSLPGLERGGGTSVMLNVIFGMLIFVGRVCSLYWCAPPAAVALLSGSCCLQSTTECYKESSSLWKWNWRRSNWRWSLWFSRNGNRLGGWYVWRHDWYLIGIIAGWPAKWMFEKGNRDAFFPLLMACPLLSLLGWTTEINKH